MTIKTLIGELERFHTGSRFICNPAPEGTDDDWVILVSHTTDAALELRGDGFSYGGSIPPSGSSFLSLKRTVYDSTTGNDGRLTVTSDTVNAIITSDMMWYHKMKAATSIARRLNLLNKEDRVALFAAVIEGKIDMDNINGPIELMTPTIGESTTPQLDIRTLDDGTALRAPGSMVNVDVETYAVPFGMWDANPFPSIQQAPTPVVEERATMTQRFRNNSAFLRRLI